MIQKTIEMKGKVDCIESYGYIAEKKNPLWENAESVLQRMSKCEYFNRPYQMAYHNLCETLSPPKGLGITLGLGLKFCIQADKPKSDITASFDRFTEDVRKRFIFSGQPLGFTPKKIYIKSKWSPKKSDTIEHLEHRISSFINNVQYERSGKINQQQKSTNLTKIQQNHIKYLQNNNDFITLMADKNLGPCIIERKSYIDNILDEHLTNGNTYKILQETEATQKLEKIKDNLIKILRKFNTNLNKDEKNYFRRILIEEHRTPQFYGMPKVHKAKNERQTTPYRPVVSQCGSLSAAISTFIDHKLQAFTHSIPSYIQNSPDLLNQLDSLDTLLMGAHLFTSDATSMYTNIDPGEGVDVLVKYLMKYNNETQKGGIVHIEFMKELISLVMNNNVFQFGDSYWLQEIGTAMGTPCACIYATIFFAWFEREFILQKYKDNLLFYKRQIDDIFGIWIDNPDNPNQWQQFNNDLNNYCKLQWNTEKLSKKVNFLDLTIWIDEQGKIQYCTFQKPMNLFLYIPAHSAHPPGVLKSLIHGLMKTYHRQNSNVDDFKRNVQQLFKCLLARGYNHHDISTMFEEAANTIKHNQLRRRHQNQQQEKYTSPPRIKQEKNKKNDIFFHIPYHPRDITRNNIQRIYSRNCDNKDNLGESFKTMKNDMMGGTMRIDKLTVAYSRGKNMRDTLCQSKLRTSENYSVTQIIQQSSKSSKVVGTGPGGLQHTTGL